MSDILEGLMRMGAVYMREGGLGAPIRVDLRRAQLALYVG
jgi:hypothetical protein